MTAALWALLALALSLYPLPTRGELRLRRLVAAGRLAPAVPKGRWRPRLVVPSLPMIVGLATLTGCVVAVVWDVALGVAAAVAVGMAGRSVTRIVSRRRAAARLAGAIAGLRLLCGELAAGALPPTALSAASESVAGQSAVAFAAAAEAARADGDVVGELLRDPLLAAVGHGWQLAATTGAPLVGVLSRVEQDLAARADQARQVATALAGPRSSAMLLAGLPVLGVVLGTALGARPLALLVGTGLGHFLLCAGIVLDAAGLAWTARLITSAERA